MNVILKPVGLQTHKATGVQHVSFRVVSGTFPSGPWTDTYLIMDNVLEPEPEVNPEAVNQ